MGRVAGMKVRFILAVVCDDCEAAVGGRSRIGVYLDGNSSAVWNGPSRAFAGLAGRLPGIVSNAVPLLGATGDETSRNGNSTCDVSHESNGSECVVATERTLEPRESVVLEASNLVRELFGLTACWNETRESRQEERLGSVLDAEADRGAAA